MVARLPSLKSLEVFVRAGQLLSFGAAASELNLSPSAISRRIRALEEELDTLLFVRRSKSVELTPAGARYLEALAPAFAAIKTATQDIVNEANRITLTVPQSFAFSWLTPCLPAFRTAHPDVELDIEVSGDITGRYVDDFDIGIFLSNARWKDRHSESLAAISTFPVCSPELAETLVAPADLAGATLLHVRQLPNAWEEWLAAAGAISVFQSPGREKDITFNDVQLAYEAAQKGVGIAVGADIVVEEYLRDGRLIAPFAERVESGFQYHLVTSKSRLRDPAIRKLRQWLHAEIENSDLR